MSLLSKVFPMFFCPCLLLAKTFSPIGHTFEIQEESFLELLEKRMSLFKASGKLEELEEEIKKRVQERVITPAPVQGVQTTDFERSFYYDPSLVVDQDIKDHKGTLIHKKGTRVNPLHILNWGDPLLLINGEDEAQIQWATSQKGKIVLLKGSPIRLYRQTGVRFYFDQGGKIVEKFQIKQVPARITQSGQFLLVEEVRV